MKSFLTLLFVMFLLNTHAASDEKLPDGKLLQKLKTIVIPRIDFEDVRLPDAVKYLREQSKKLDPDGIGVNIFLRPPVSPISKATRTSNDIDAMVDIEDKLNDVTLNLVLTRKTMLEAIHFMCRAGNLQYRVEKYAIVIAHIDEVPLGELDINTYTISNYIGNNVYQKMGNIMLPSVEFYKEDIYSVIRYLNRSGGVNIVYSFSKETANTFPKITMNFSNIPMREVLRYLCQALGTKYRIDEEGTVSIGTNADELQTRTFQLPVSMFSEMTGIQFEGTQDENKESSPSSLPSEALVRCFLDYGVTIGDGTSLEYDHRTGKLTVKNSAENLHKIEQVIAAKTGNIQKTDAEFPRKKEVVGEIAFSDTKYYTDADWNRLNQEVAELCRIGEYAAAVPLAEKSLKIAEKNANPDQLDIAVSLNIMADLYCYQQRYAKAEPLYKRALAIREKTPDSEYCNVISTLSDLAAMYYAQGQYDQAEKIYKRILAIMENSFGPDHPDVITCLNNIALIYRKTGRKPEAITTNVQK